MRPMMVVDISTETPAADANAKIEGLKAEGYEINYDLCSPGRLVLYLPKSKEKKGNEA